METQSSGYKKVVGFIPARGGKQSLHEKNLKRIGGRTLLSIGIRSLKEAGINDIYVSTECGKTKLEAIRNGAHVVDRPAQYSSPTSPTEDVIGHFLREVDCGIVVMRQVTSPLVSPESIAEGLNKFIEGEYDSMFSAVRENDLLLWYEDSMTPINYDFTPGNRGFRQDRPHHTLIETGGFFIFTREMFERHRCRFGGKIGYCEVPFWESFQMDDYNDLIHLRKLSNG
jgi:N-acylneuraminate cytidylyltransferase